MRRRQRLPSFSDVILRVRVFRGLARDLQMWHGEVFLDFSLSWSRWKLRRIRTVFPLTESISVTLFDLSPIPSASISEMLDAKVAEASPGHGQVSIYISWSWSRRKLRRIRTVFPLTESISVSLFDLSPIPSASLIEMLDAKAAEASLVFGRHSSR